MKSVSAPFPGGTFEVTPEVAAAVCDAVNCPAELTAFAHPILYYIATQSAMGLSVEELLERCDFRIEDGPLMTESEVLFSADIEVGQRYAVRGEILSLERKPSRTFGAVDELKFELLLSREDGTEIMRCVNSWLLPRRGESA